MRVTMERKKLKEILKSQTKDKLMDLTYIYPIKGKSKLKKEELVNALYEVMISQETTYENAIVLAEEFKELDKDENNDMTRVRKFINLGYGKTITSNDGIEFIVAGEIDDIFLDLPATIDEDISRYSLIKKYILACVRLYGAIEIDFLIELFNKQNSKENPLGYEELDIQFNRCKKICQEAERYANCIISGCLLMFDGEIEELMTRRENKEFYVPNKEELLKYTDEFYIEKNSHYIELEKFIYKKVKNKEMAQGILEDLTDSLRFEDVSIQSVMNEFNRRDITFDSIKEVEKFMKVYVDLSNNTRNWFNKGNTPKELSKCEELSHLHKEHIGRNNPCSCGSGKKYKKCCINKNPNH